MLRTEMFGMGMGEIVVILVIALLFLGPDKLPDAAKAISKGIRDLRKQTRELQSSLEGDNDIGSAIREIKGALRGDDLRIRPLVPATPSVRELAKNTFAAGEPIDPSSPAALDSAAATDELDIGADDHLPEPHAAAAFVEPDNAADNAAADAPAESAPASDPSLPLIRPAGGTVAKSRAAAASASAADEAPPNSAKDSSSHG